MEHRKVRFFLSSSSPGSAGAYRRAKAAYALDKPPVQEELARCVFSRGLKTSGVSLEIYTVLFLVDTFVSAA